LDTVLPGFVPSSLESYLSEKKLKRGVYGGYCRLSCPDHFGWKLENGLEWVLKIFWDFTGN
jgi:hypothetical protein